MPILESFACGCPIVCSNTNALKEIARNGAHYFNPKDILDMRGCIDDVLTDSTLQKDLINAGHKRLKSFSWDICRKETNLIYQSI